ncbi:spore coat protein CotJB [Hominifimenecus sp. rT4P-3]|uniref:spore coat protein CotJB n=1 Tax=Hominifimenecus sp. rT4P-3 TaxID=3242979 RepID=UPI003DA2BD5D
MQNEHLAIATVPCQPWGERFTEEQAFKNGTIFKDLYLPFFAAEENCGCKKEERLRQKAKGEDEACILQQLDEISFYLDDLNLYLDTHPQDKEAIELYCEYSQKRAQLKQEYDKQFGPLTRDCIWKCEGSKDTFCWQEGPMPWEGACV